MADEEKEQESAPEKKKSPIILVVVLVLVGLILAGGISFFVTTKMMSNPQAESVSEHHDPGVFIKLGDAKEGILVNVGGQKAGKFLKTSIVLEMNPGKKDNILEGVLKPEAETKLAWAMPRQEKAGCCLTKMQRIVCIVFTIMPITGYSI